MDWNSCALVLWFSFFSLFLSRIICQWIGRTVFNSSFINNVETSMFAYLKDPCNEMFEKGMHRNLSERHGLKENHGLQNCIKGSQIGKKTQGDLFYPLY